MADDVVRIVQQTRAIQWWIDQQLARDVDTATIERELPVAAAFICGRLSLDALSRLLVPKSTLSGDDGSTAPEHP
jgi:hypothetical protein